MRQQQKQQQQPQPQAQYPHSNSMSLMFVTTSMVISPLSPHCLCRLRRLWPRRRAFGAAAALAAALAGAAAGAACALAADLQWSQYSWHHGVD